MSDLEMAIYAYRKNIYESAARSFEQAYNAGDDEAGLWYALCLYHGHGVTQNQEEAQWTLQHLSDKGNAYASILLSCCEFLENHDVDQSLRVGASLAWEGKMDEALEHFGQSCDKRAKALVKLVASDENWISDDLSVARSWAPEPIFVFD